MPVHSPAPLLVVPSTSASRMGPVSPLPASAPGSAPASARVGASDRAPDAAAPDAGTEVDDAGSAVVRCPSPALRHLLGRFSYGVTPGVVHEARRAGGARAWFDQQLDHEAVVDGAWAYRSWYPGLAATPTELWDTYASGGRRGWETTTDLQRWTLLRRTYSHRQVFETMVEFWSDVVHVPIPGGTSWPWRVRYDSTVRRHALGRFDDLLVATVLHPAMSCYLDNAVNTADDLNENLGREVLEVHTVGIQADFTEAEVRDSARILTGYHVDLFGTWEASYRPEDHATGAVRVLGFRHRNARADGRRVARNYLRWLAHHPATAQRLARRLAVRFVSDDPPAALVDHVANAYLAADTDIPTTLRALVDHPAFDDAIGSKVRTPTQDAVNTWRVLGIRVDRPTNPDDFALVLDWQAESMGQRPFDWPRPDGFPDVAEAWTSASRMLRSWNAHWGLAGGWWPATGARYRDHASWMPPLPQRYGQVVDHLSRRLLARPSTPLLRAAAVAATTIPLDRQLDTTDDLTPFRLAQTLAVVLDSPAHLQR